MPCNSEYQQPNQREAESKKVAGLLVYVHNKLGRTDLPRSVELAATTYYGAPERCDELTERLCSMLRDLTVEEQNAVLYDGRIPKARELADWWERHQEHDRQRAEAEARAAKPTLKQAVSAVIAQLDYSVDGKVFPTEGSDQLPPKLAKALNDMTDAWNDGR
ncbi:hypothetical protein phiCbK_035 [Caulobacter phage phiCbK]|uniref:Uncharacterized protein n=5 Tax=Viruses TaxID=10239 RepID=K4JTN5_9CAUD|nr:hypothetical protein D865_gp132 [Caulobacter phage phiCbK]AFO71549.1 hypothetical protein phiCbK_035 [Caulobacter phage phiCbK]AFU87118.1 hypothetical protein CbK_gp286 [Caulobacter phage phiCbK]ARB15199.1 hypothetical protein Ccr32_gp281 [Caulobacter phage Ccr32]ARB15533.1 hypothetical protein Ccr34_gp291 [Caulobacter phage Ccr34]